MQVHRPRATMHEARLRSKVAVLFCATKAHIVNNYRRKSFLRSKLAVLFCSTKAHIVHNYRRKSFLSSGTLLGRGRRTDRQWKPMARHPPPDPHIDRRRCESGPREGGERRRRGERRSAPPPRPRPRGPAPPPPPPPLFPLSPLPPQRPGAAPAAGGGLRPGAGRPPAARRPAAGAVAGGKGQGCWTLTQKSILFN